MASAAPSSTGTPPYDFDDSHHRVEGELTAVPPGPLPQLFLDGSSSAAGPVAARHAHVHLTWAETPAQVKEKIDWIRSLAEREGCTDRFAIRSHTISQNRSRGLGDREPAARRRAGADPPGRSPPSTGLVEA